MLNLAHLKITNTACVNVGDVRLQLSKYCAIGLASPHGVLTYTLKFGQVSLQNGITRRTMA
jgi:hypothetical protein